MSIDTIIEGYGLSDTDRAASAADLMSAAVGLTISSIQVLGINALKTMDPPITSAIGQRVVSVTSTSPQTVRLILEDLLIEFNLERVGIVAVSYAPTAWKISDGHMPTVRVLVDGGPTFDLREPSKTKRITLHLRRMF